jgi:hypothetical protein
MAFFTTRVSPWIDRHRLFRLLALQTDSRVGGRRAGFGK